jgi:hypothetical protein
VQPVSAAMSCGGGEEARESLLTFATDLVSSSLVRVGAVMRLAVPLSKPLAAEGPWFGQLTQMQLLPSFMF